MSPLLEFAKANHRQGGGLACGPYGMMASPVTEAPDDARFRDVEVLDYGNTLALWFVSSSTKQRYCAIILTD